MVVVVVVVVIVVVVVVVVVVVQSLDYDNDNDNDNDWPKTSAVEPRSLSENSDRSEGEPGRARFFARLRRIVGSI